LIHFCISSPFHDADAAAARWRQRFVRTLLALGLAQPPPMLADTAPDDHRRA
jgi:hypothetical protein